MYPRVFFSVRIRTAVRIKTTAAVTGTWHNSDGGRFLPGMEHYYPPQAIFRFLGIFFSAYVQQYVGFSTVSKEYLVRSRDLVQHVTVGTCVQQQVVSAVGAVGAVVGTAVGSVGTAVAIA